MIVKYSFPEGTKTSRAGVIPYVIFKNKLYFLLGVDFRSGELTDFGGGVKYDETALEGAFREFEEETHNIFSRDEYDIELIKNETVISDKKYMTIVFLPIKTKWYFTAISKYFSIMKQSSYNEIFTMKWIKEDDFKKKLYDDDKTIWCKVRNFLGDFCKQDEFYETLKELYI